MIVGLLFAVGASVVFGDHREIIRDGVLVDAEVIDKAEVFDTDGATEYIGTYRWRSASGSVHQDEWALDRDQYDALAVGDDIEVRYLEVDPKRSLPVGYGTSVGLASFITIIGLLLAGIGAVALFARRAATPEESPGYR